MNLLRGRAWMLFVDGENFTKRGQALLQEAGSPPVPGVRWLKDVFLWAPYADPSWNAITGDQLFLPRVGANVVPLNAGPLRRAYYYTSMPGHDWTAARLAIREVGFEPRMFARRRGKAKAVDVALATDVLTLGASSQYEVAVIVSGDGDFVPVVESVKRLGLHACVASFADSTSAELRIAADEFIDLGPRLVSEWATWHEDTNRAARNAATKAARGEHPPVADDGP